jgi:hypothetical protein
MALQLKQLSSVVKCGHASCSYINLIALHNPSDTPYVNRLLLDSFAEKILSILKQRSPCLDSPRRQYQR